MKRVSRQPTKIGAIDLAAEIGQELNIPLSQIAENFSFNTATRQGLEDIRLLAGRRAEKMFEYVIASLGKAELINQEDSSAPLYSGDQIQAPDFFVALKNGERYFVEVKHTYNSSFNNPIPFSKNYLSRLKRYASIRNSPLCIAVYWKAYNYWTINKVEDFETAKGTINLRFGEACIKCISGSFGNRMIGAVPPLVCRFYAQTDKASTLNSDGIANFTIGDIKLFSEGKEIVNDIEKQIAFYLIFNSKWEASDPVAYMDGNRIDYAEITSKPHMDESVQGVKNEQEFRIIGTTAGMISNLYENLTTDNDEITRIIPHWTPDEMNPGIDESYKGEDLRLWQFQFVPNYDS
ncbi:hypothetical protein IB233_21470 [Comamonas sp. CMM01]|uniref:hypothetical protein n=1 Tax=Comamonas sp. CMM01 TaxID=2769280 RepID=UPI0017823D35|nr:hypothetical protein [Comamonas sp. CMM01]MBD9534198.1 hypothetical protein [Comamonas sp. CMM01]